MAYSWNTYTGDGSTTNFSLTFSFISRTHVKVYLDSVEQTTGWSWVSDGVIAFATAPGSGVVVRIQRVTPKASRLVTFQDAAVMTAEDQNDSADQNFMAVQEQIDQESNYLQLDTDDKYDAQSKKIKNLAAGVLDHEAVRVDQMLPYQTACQAAQTAAEAAQTAAETAQTAAETAETNAETAETNAAADAATVAADKAIVAADKATVAADKATVAADKATVAADKATTLGYKNDAEQAETDAQTAQTAAEAAQTAAETARDKAQDWAEEAEDTEVETGKYSAYHWAQKADEWANAAIHDDQANEISGIAEKVTPVDNDIFLIEDSEASYVKKKLKMTNILAGSTAAGTSIDDAAFDKFLDDIDEGTDFLQDVLDLIDEQAVEVVEQAAEPATTYPGLIWIDTDDQVNPNSDADAIHDNTSGEIAAVTEKAAPVGADLIIIEDSAAGNAKKRVQLSNLPSHTPASHTHTESDITDLDRTRAWTYGSQIACTSGTTRDLSTSIPSWVTEIEVLINKVSTNTASQPPIVQIGDSGGYETSGYTGSAAYLGSSGWTDVSSGFYCAHPPGVAAADTISGVMRLHRWDVNENIWIMTSMMAEDGSAQMYGTAGIKTLSAVLDRIRLNTPGGTATFDSGEARIRYR